MTHQHIKQRAYLGAAFRSDSRAAEALAARTGASTTAAASGFVPRPDLNLSFHGGRTIPSLAYFNFYVGGAVAWADSDVTNIDQALGRAMTDRRLNNVLLQYFHGQSISGTFAGRSRILAGTPPRIVSRGAFGQWGAGSPEPASGQHGFAPAGRAEATSSTTSSGLPTDFSCSCSTRWRLFLGQVPTRQPRRTSSDSSPRSVTPLNTARGRESGSAA